MLLYNFGKIFAGPPPTQSIGKKIFFLFFLADSENIYLSYVLRKKIFFSVLSTTFLKYRKKSMSNFKKNFFFIGDQNKHDFYRFGMFLYNFGKKNFFEKISKSNFFKYRKMAMSIFSVKNIFSKNFFFSDTTQNAKFRGLGCFSTTLVPDPPHPKYRKKNFFLIFLR